MAGRTTGTGRVSIGSAGSVPYLGPVLVSPPVPCEEDCGRIAVVQHFAHVDARPSSHPAIQPLLSWGLAALDGEGRGNDGDKRTEMG